MQYPQNLSRSTKFFPNHRFTRSALRAAQHLADDLFPVTELQRAAQAAIYKAVESGDLYATIVVVDGARSMAEGRQIATTMWRKLADDWLEWIRIHILAKLNESETSSTVHADIRNNFLTQATAIGYYATPVRISNNQIEVVKRLHQIVVRESVEDLPYALRELGQAYSVDIKGHNIPLAKNWIARKAFGLAEAIEAQRSSWIGA
jgi:hypothetical protein